MTGPYAERIRVLEAQLKDADKAHARTLFEFHEMKTRAEAMEKRVTEALVAHEIRMEKLHTLVLEARDLIRPNLEPASPSWLRRAFEQLHAVHHGMGGDPLTLHIRAALEAKS